MGQDFISKLIELERILQELKASGYGTVDEFIRSAFDPEKWLRQFAAIGIDISQIRNMPRQLEKANPYKVLGLEKTATEKEVKKRYRELAYLIHPDTAGVEGTEHFCQELNEAYQQILKERGWK